MNALKNVVQLFNKHNKVLILMTTVMTVLLASMLSISATTQIYLEHTQLSKERVYGGYSHIIYGSKLSNVSQKYGRIDIVQSNSQPDIVYGALNQAAYQYSYLENTVNMNEVLITQSIATKFNVKVGDTFDVNGIPKTIKQIINPMGLMWIKGQSEELRQFKFPNVIVSSQVLEQLVESQGNREVVWLARFDRKQAPNEWEALSGNHYINTYILGENNNTQYKIPEYFQNILSIIFCIIIVVVLRAYILYSRPRYEIYRLLGVKNGQSNILFVFEMLTIAVLTCVLGIMLSVGVTSSLLSIALRQFYILEIGNVRDYIIKYTVMYMLSVCLSLLIFSVHTKNKSYMKINLLARKFYTYIDIKKIYLSISVWFCTILLVFFVGHLFMHFNSINAAILSTDAVGKMPSDFDYEITLKDIERLPGQTYHDNAYYETSKETYGELIDYKRAGEEMNSIAQEIKTAFPDSIIKKYTSLWQVYLLDEKVLNQDYIMKLYEPKVYQNRPFWNTLLNYSGKMVLIRVRVYPDEDILRFSSSFTGDVGSVLNGEKVYIIAPSYEYFETHSKEGVVLREAKPIDKDDSRATVERVIDETTLLKLASLQANSSVVGMVSSEQAKQLFTVKHVNVSISGISHRQVAWLDYGDLGVPYRLIVSERFLEKQGLETNPTRLRVSFNQFDYRQDNLKIRQILSKYPTVTFTDNYEQLDVFRQYRMMQSGITWLLISIFVVLSILIFNSIIQSHIVEQYQKYSVYVLLGMSFKKLFTMLVLPMIGSVCIAFVLLIALEFKVFLGLPNLVGIKTWINMLVYLGVPCLFIILVIYVITWRQINKFIRNIR
ncbi:MULTISPECIES: ABC transporter permease [unclassified Granulicatella]|uniref:ABC transporter permease n=1 Tax=unclassified Granulicatella TaxID=2630493 RepID=UPI0010733D51|nr:MULTISPECIES: ABC transporter permease [unclassified Granulicatella]MBF0780728.1 hypothetical protein [Granulicatella sp. 19428wC4_WM01]TFU94187.1 ABC transporter permease [Granulicatella sp. WM01]